MRVKWNPDQVSYIDDFSNCLGKELCKDLLGFSIYRKDCDGRKDLLTHSVECFQYSTLLLLLMLNQNPNDCFKW